MAANSLRLAGVSLLVFLSTIPLSAYYYNAKEKQELVDKHNEYRRREKASDMLKMVWDGKLERMAAMHARRCTWEHNKRRQSSGESLMANPGILFPTIKPVEVWHREIEFYNHTTNACKAKKVCGHYTQVIWATSYKLGCAKRYCPSLKNIGKELSMVVCNYQPAGNSRSFPHKRGGACSQCPPGTTCENLLCVNTGHSDIFKGGKLETIIPILAFVLFPVLDSL